MYRDFWQLYIKEYGRLRMALLICVVVIGVSLFEALNIGLLLPLLDTLNASGEQGAHWVTKVIAGLFTAIGIPFELGPILLVMATIFLGSLMGKAFKATPAILGGRVLANSSIGAAKSARTITSFRNEFA